MQVDHPKLQCYITAVGTFEGFQAEAAGAIRLSKAQKLGPLGNTAERLGSMMQSVVGMKFLETIAPESTDQACVCQVLAGLINGVD